MVNGRAENVVQYGSFVYLELNKPGLMNMPLGGQEPLRLTTESFTVNYFMKAAILKYWRGGEFHDHYTAD